MMQTESVSKDLVFKMRLDAEDRDLLDGLARHYSAPAATVVRILIKEKHASLGIYRPRSVTAGHPMAQEYARKAHEDHFESHWGWFRVEDEEGDETPDIVLFDNHPSEWRDEAHTELRAWLASQHFAIHGEASYPLSGNDAGYTTAMVVVGVTDEQQKQIQDRWGAINESMMTKKTANVVRLPISPKKKPSTKK